VSCGVGGASLELVVGCYCWLSSSPRLFPIFTPTQANQTTKQPNPNPDPNPNHTSRFGRGRGRRPTEPGGPSLFGTLLTHQAASISQGLAQFLEPASILQIGGDGGETLVRLLQGCAFSPLRRVYLLDWVFGRLGRAAHVIEGTVERSQLLAFAGEGLGAAAAAAAEQAAPGGGQQQRSGEGAGGSAQLQSAPSLSAISAAGSSMGEVDAPAAAAADNTAAAPAPAPAQDVAAAAAAAWQAEVTLLQGDLDSTALASPAGWAAAGVPGCNLAVVSDAAEQLGSAGDAAAMVGRHVLGGLRPKVLLVTMPNRCVCMRVAG